MLTMDCGRSILAREPQPEAMPFVNPWIPSEKWIYSRKRLLAKLYPHCPMLSGRIIASVEQVHACGVQRLNTGFPSSSFGRRTTGAYVLTPSISNRPDSFWHVQRRSWKSLAANGCGLSSRPYVTCVIPLSGVPSFENTLRLRWQSAKIVFVAPLAINGESTVGSWKFSL